MYTLSDRLYIHFLSWYDKDLGNLLMFINIIAIRFTGVLKGSMHA